MTITRTINTTEPVNGMDIVDLKRGPTTVFDDETWRQACTEMNAE